MNLCECSGGWLYGWFIHQRRDIHIQNWAGYLLGKIIGEGLIEIRFSFATVDSYDIYFMKYHSWISIFISPSFSNLKIDSHWLNKKIFPSIFPLVKSSHARHAPCEASSWSRPPPRKKTATCARPAKCAPKLRRAPGGDGKIGFPMKDGTGWGP